MRDRLPVMDLSASPCTVFRISATNSKALAAVD
jgi:hypothetical protein